MQEFDKSFFVKTQLFYKELYLFVACDARGTYRGLSPYDGPFGVPEYGEYWTDENISKNGQLTAIQITNSSRKISAIRVRYV